MTAPQHRFVLLGASNLTLGFPLIVHALLRSFAEPIEIVSAHGHGRSYRHWSYVLHRGLPGIPGCGLWEELNARPAAHASWGLITDVGNDLIYGSTPRQVIAGVRLCFERLAESEAPVILVRPPKEQLLRLSDWRYRTTKRIFFPGPVRPWEEMKQSLIDLDRGLEELAEETGAIMVHPQETWYGIDPIHIRRARRSLAWESILNRWPLAEPMQVGNPGLRYGLRIWRSPPAERSLFRTVSRHAQPVLTWESGSSLSLY